MNQTKKLIVKKLTPYSLQLQVQEIFSMDRKRVFCVVHMATR